MSRRRGRTEEWQEVTINKIVNGQPLKVTIDNAGRFSAEVAGQRISETTMDATVAAAAKWLKKAKVRVSIPATIVNQTFHESRGGYGGTRAHWFSGIGVRHVTFTGLHSATGATLAKDERTGETVQHVEASRDVEVLRRLSPEQIETYERLRHAADAAAETLEKFYNDHRLHSDRHAGLSDLIKEALAQAMDEPKEPEEDSGDPRT